MSAGFKPSMQLASVRPDGSRLAIHPADVKGRFITRRRLLFAALIGIYVALPLVHLNGHPLIHLDVEGRRFFLFGQTFNAQDFWMVLLLVTTVLFAIIFLTAWLGRVWCGWACPQTVFLEGVYRPIERLFDGPRERRLRRAGEPLGPLRAARSVAKHGAYLLMSLALSQVALSLFLSAKDLTAMILEGPFAHPVAFAWSMGMTSALYFNYAWFREQLCFIVCPYGRLQSALQDRDSIIVGYDVRRGEPRGHLKKHEPRSGLGDCVDCNRCVTACPTGIDIRQGLQMECLACAQCIDACDDVMTRIGKPRGLIRYDSQNGFDGLRHRFLRGRLLAYGALFAVVLVGLVVALWLRTPFEANLLRTPGVPWVLDVAEIRNQLTLHLVNKNPAAATFELAVEAPSGVKVILPSQRVRLEPLQGLRLPLFVSAAREGYRAPFQVKVEVKDTLSGEERELALPFLGPPQAPRPVTH